MELFFLLFSNISKYMKEQLICNQAKSQNISENFKCLYRYLKHFYSTPLKYFIPKLDTIHKFNLLRTYIRPK